MGLALGEETGPAELEDAAHLRDVCLAGWLGEQPLNLWVSDQIRPPHSGIEMSHDLVFILTGTEKLAGRQADKLSNHEGKRADAAITELIRYPADGEAFGVQCQRFGKECLFLPFGKTASHVGVEKPIDRADTCASLTRQSG